MAIKKKTGPGASAKKAKAKPSSSGKTSPKETALQPELALIRGMASILNETGLTEIELDQRGMRVRVTRAPALSPALGANASPLHHHTEHFAPSPHSSLPVTVEQAADELEPAGEVVKSPMVGTVYLAASPGSQPFIEVGTLVKQGQTLLIIEAMKTMNQIKSPVTGKVVKLFVDNGNPVEFGSSLVIIE